MKTRKCKYLKCRLTYRFWGNVLHCYVASLQYRHPKNVKLFLYLLKLFKKQFHHPPRKPNSLIFTETLNMLPLQNSEAHCRRLHRAYISVQGRTSELHVVIDHEAKELDWVFFYLPKTMTCRWFCPLKNV